VTTAPPDAPAGTEPEGRKRRISGSIEWVLIVAGALVAALVIKTFLFQAFYIPSPSMTPTLAVNDRVLVNKLSYRLHDINRGDIVVFERPPSEEGILGIKDLIKRVVGLPGETVESKDGIVYVDDEPLTEDYLPPGTMTEGLERTTIPEGTVFVMGDNRANSKDSRVFGPVSQESVVGRAFVRVWPMGSFGFL
jgi:signal peptidase I